MKKFRNENEMKYSLENDFPVPERLSPENIEATLKGDITATSFKSKKDSNGKVYAKGPNLWTIGATAAAVAIFGAGAFFFGLGSLPFGSSHGGSAANQPSSGGEQNNSELTEYEEKLAQRPNLTITVDGYERTGKTFQEIKVEDLNYGEDITVHLKLGNSEGQINGVDIWGGTYYIFFDGYSALDLTDEEIYNEEYVQFINKMGSGEFTKTNDGYAAEYTFSFDDLNEISRKEKTFNITAIAYVDFDDNRSTDGIYIDALYNTAYADQNKISYLEELYSDEEPGSQGTTRFYHHYDGLLKRVGYYHSFDEPYINMLGSSINVAKNKDDGKVYLSFHKSGNRVPEYLFEDAYYMFVFINDELVPLNIDPRPDDGTYDDIVSYQTLIECTDVDGSSRFFCAPLGDISDIKGVDVITIPVTPYSGNFGSIYGKSISNDD